MACDLATVQANACASGIGEVTAPIKLLQLTAELAREWAFYKNAPADYSLAAIQERTCTSGIGKVTDAITLYKLIAQNICNLNT